MDITSLLGGKVDLAALFGVNAAPTEAEIVEAQRDAVVYGEAAEALVAKVGLRKGAYASEQPIYGPLVRMLSLAGWTVSGSGFFSVVFYKGGLALKISLRGSGDAAMDYLDWCKGHQGKPGIPTLHAMNQMDYTYTVLMDRLESIEHKLNPESVSYCCFMDAEYQDAKAALNQGVAPEGFPSGATALAIRDEFKGRGRFDLHKANVMADRDGKFVITDPLGRSQERDTYYGGYTYYTGSNDNYSQAA